MFVTYSSILFSRREQILCLSDRHREGHPLQASAPMTQNPLGKEVPLYPPLHLFSPPFFSGGTAASASSLPLSDGASNPYQSLAHDNPCILRLQEYLKATHFQVGTTHYDQQGRHLVNPRQGQLSPEFNTPSLDPASLLASPAAAVATAAAGRQDIEAGETVG